MPTAEEAAAANLAWRAVNAPETISASERAQAAQYSQRYYSVERPAQLARDAQIQETIRANRAMIDRQEGYESGGTHTLPQLAAHYGSAERGREAYAREEAYYEAHPSAAFLSLTAQYAASRNRIVTSSGSYAATGELVLNTTAGEGGFTGRAAEYKAAFEREVYGIGAPDNEAEYYRRQALQAVTTRPGYTPASDLGDITTIQARKAYGMFADAMAMQGVQLASEGRMTGQILETQRQMAYATPERRDERFFMGELQKWGQGYVETASAYHHIGMASGERIPANPFEYQADLAVELLKGSPTQDKERFSPVSGELKPYLPNQGEGLQGFAWREAITDYKRQWEDARTPYPEQVSFMPAVQYVGAAEGKYGPYGKLYGGIDNGGVSAPMAGPVAVPVGRVPAASENEYKQTLAPDGAFFGIGIPGLAFFQPSREITTTTKTVGDQRTITTVETPLPTGFDMWLGGANEQVRSTLGFDKIPAPTNEQIKQTAPYLAIVPGATPIGMALMTPGPISEYTSEYLRGEVTAIQEKPVSAGAMFGAGLAIGGIFKGGEALYGAGRAAIAEKVISQGGAWRGIEQGGHAIMTYGPKVLGGLYAVDVGSRVTNFGTDFSPAAAYRGGQIMTTEVRPMTAGAVIGYQAPGMVYKAAKIADINYQAAFQEGATKGRFDYYIKQPASRPYELIKQDYIAYAQERMSRTPTVSLERPTVRDYLYQRGGFDITPAPEPVTIKATQKYAATELGLQPISTEYGSAIIPAAYRGKIGTGTYVPAPKEIPLLGKKINVLQGGKWTTKYVEPTGEMPADLSARAYGKERSIWDFTLRGKQAEPSTLGKYPLAEYSVDIRAVYPRGYSVRQKIAAFRQENPNLVRDITTPLFTPKKGGRLGGNIAQEISDINRMSALSREYAASMRATAAPKAGKPFKRTPFSATFGKMAQKPKAPEKGEVEIRSGSGAVSVAKVDVIERPPMSAPLQGQLNVPMVAPAGRIQYPSGPSPIRRNVYIEQEETEYYRPDIVERMSGIGAGRGTVLSPVPITATLPISETVRERKQFTGEMVRQEQLIRPVSIFETQQRGGQQFGQELRYKQNLDFGRGVAPALRVASMSTTIPVIMMDTRQDLGREIVTEQKTRVDTIQRVTPVQWTDVPPRPEPVPKTPKITIPGGFLPGGGGGTRGAGGLGVTRWQRMNLVATQEYLARGIAGPGSGISAPRKRRKKGFALGSFGYNPFA